ncbi:MAG TPA: choice-of-anchor J domain-containing protein [Chitinophagaceae bacterium]|nr:choice-of-anchor J domain-containing protein [Chitinophagaceae bacterium]
MKKFTFLAFTALLLLGSSNSFAQQRTQPINPTSERLHCATMEALELYFQQNPAARELAEQNKNRFAPESSNRTSRTGVVVEIPIVFHIVGNSTRLAQVTDADVLWQLNKLNEDFRGANADSTNATAFYPVRAYRDYCQIQFCLAQRDPNNLPTNGITRTPSTLTGTTLCSGNNYNMLKHTAQGGIDAWDPTRYLNVWVGEVGECLLGIAQFPGAGNADEFGVVLAFDGFGNNPAYVDPSFNLGRTLPHELGHCFGLFHLWGDESGCVNSDFRQLSGSCILPASLAGTTGDQSIGDTPNQAGATAGCPSGVQTDACSGTAPGFMYQNFMDYTNDACYSLFTQKQVDRMQWVLDNCLASLKTSNGCVPPVLTPDNAGISAVLNPSAGFVSCDPTVPLTVTLRNFGSNALTSVTITVVRNGTTVQTFPWTGNLASLAAVNIPLNAVPLALGANSIQICTSLPNGVADSDPANDCKTVSGNRGAGGTLPLVEGFESATFPPAGWIRNNPDGGITWARSTTGVAHSGTGKAYVDHYDYLAAGQTDDLRTPPFAIGTADSLWLSFWAAYRGYSDIFGTILDNFQVMVSTDCGQTFQVVYDVRNDTAFVAPQGAAPTQGAEYTPSAADQWIRKAIDLSSFINAGNIQVQFRAINGYGNNLYIDDINIDKKIFANNDAGVIAINKPDSKACTSSQAPVVVIKNYGKVNLTSVKINYQIDGAGPITTVDWTGNLARNQVETVTLPTAALGAVGNHSIRVYTTLPNNVADEDPTSDTLVKSYRVFQVIPLPGTVTEDFSSGTFPPPNWEIINPNGDITWTRNASVGNRSAGSAYFNDYVNTNVDRIDDLAMPNYSYSGIDSIFLSFNLAHLTRTLPGTTGSRLDTLTILLSKDCGNTFTIVYKKWGEDLQTVNDPNFQTSMLPFVPKANEWRRDSVNLGKWLSSTEPLLQVVYRFSGNIENNFYLDDINLRTQTLPQKLKNQGYLVLPNPFRSAFGVWHYQAPTTLRYINVYNSVGQLVYSKQFPAGGEKYVQINLGGRAAGVYTVNLGYEDSNRNVNVQVVKY